MTTKPVPPPLPARARKPPATAVAHAPVPSDEGFMSTQSKMSLVEIALALRDEQLAARIVHYKADLATNSELDMITAQVVAELQQLQRTANAAHPAVPTTPEDRAQIEIELIQSLKAMLQRLFRADKIASVVERKLAEASKRFARLFFESELHEKMRGSTTELKSMSYPEQALYLVFARNEAFLVRQLEAFEFTSPDMLDRAKETLADWTIELRNGFLSKTTPELNALVKLLNEVLTTFFTEELPPLTGELAWEVVKEGRLGEAKVRAGYKISADAFPRFRQAFERKFLHRLVPFAEEEMLRRVRAMEGKFRRETIRFVADPHIFSDVCELVCDAVYDFLYNDGFLDLPQDWRNRVVSAV